MKRAGGPKKGKNASGPAASIKLPKGEVLCDLRKQSWKVGDPIGRGGFGEIYLAEQADQCHRDVPASAKHVIKIEPVGNGPLFSEISFYTRCAKKESIEQFARDRKMAHLGMPRYIAQGRHTFHATQYRFMVMERFYADVDSKFVSSGRVLPRPTVCRLAIAILNVLEYLHSQFYVHADTKGSNLLLASTAENEVYVVDFGLAALYTIDGKHRVYKEDPKRAHDGTIEFTSRDAHNGVAPSRRSDLEILGYVLLQWLCSRLPWEDSLANKPEVARQKTRYMTDIPALMKACFKGKSVPGEIQEYLKIVKDTTYDQDPNYNKLRAIFSETLSKNRWADRGKLQWSSTGKSTATRKRKSMEQVSDENDDGDNPEPKSQRRKRGGAKAAASSCSDNGTDERHDAAAAAAPRKRGAAAARHRTTASPPAKRKTVVSPSRPPRRKAGSRTSPAAVTPPAKAKPRKGKNYEPASSKIPSPSAIRGPPLHI